MIPMYGIQRNIDSKSRIVVDGVKEVRSVHSMRGKNKEELFETKSIKFATIYFDT